METVNNLKKGKKDKIICLLAFFCTALMCIGVSAAAGIAPFGDKTMIIADADAQYTSFWMYMRDMLMGKQSPSYSMEMTIGGNVAGLLGYYCASPFNLIFLFFPPEKMPLAVHLIILLKLSLSSFFTAIYFKHTRGLEFYSLIFTSLYAFCAYNISFSWCVMWLDGVMLLPLIALGLRYLHENRGVWLYILTLAAAIISNYYIGFILCGFSLIFYAALLIEKAGKPSVKNLFCFIFSSLAVGGLSAVVLIPSLCSMQDSKRIPFTGIFEGYIASTKDTAIWLIQKFFPSIQENSIRPYISFIIIVSAAAFVLLLILLCRSKKTDIRIKATAIILTALALMAYGSVYDGSDFFLAKLLTGESEFWEMMDGYPALYSGIITIVLIPFYFMCRGIERKKKYSKAFLLLILLVSMHIRILNVMWHGFTYNSLLNYRYTFIFSFVLICLGDEAVRHIKEFRFRHIFSAMLLCVCLITLSKFSKKPIADEMRYLYVFAEFAVLCIALFFAGSIKYSKTIKALFSAVLVLTAAVSAFYNAMNGTVLLTSESSLKEFEDVYIRGSEISSGMQSADSSLYRASIGDEINGPMLLNFKGISHFSSNEEVKVVDFLSSLGFAHSGSIWASGIYGRTQAMDSFFGVKYMTDPKNKEFCTAADNGLFENSCPFPIVFAADKAAVSTRLDSVNCYDNQNLLFKSICPEIDEPVYIKENEVKKQFYNLCPAENGYDVKDEGEPAEIRYRIVADMEQPLYLYSRDGGEREGDIYLNGRFIQPYSKCNYFNSVYLGRFEEGEELEISIVLKNSDHYASDDISFYYENQTVIKKIYDSVISIPCDTISENDAHFLSTVSTDRDNQILLYTIPYNKAWKMKIDGADAEPESAFGVLMAAELPPGEHQIEISFVQPGIKEGIAITLFSALALSAYALYERKHRKNNFLLQQ